jgi:hypothetical protein
MSEVRHRSVARQELERLRMDIEQRRHATNRLHVENTTLTRNIEHIREDERQKRFTAENAMRQRNADLELQTSSLRGELDHAQAVISELRQHLDTVERENANLRNVAEEGRSASVRVHELTIQVDGLLKERTELKEELKGAVKADTCRVLEGKVQGLTKLLDEREAAEDAVLAKTQRLLEDLAAKGREVEDARAEASKSEHLVGEYVAMVDDLRLKLRFEKQANDRVRQRAAEESAALRKKVDERDAEIRRLSAESSDALHDMRQERRRAAEAQVALEELRNELSLSQQVLEQTRADLAEAQRLEAAAGERWRQAQLTRETNDGTFAKERVVASAQAAEISQLRMANSTLEGVCEGLRVDMRQLQRQLDEERSSSARELEQLRLMCAGANVRGRMIAASSGAPSAVLGGVVSPARPMKL